MEKKEQVKEKMKNKFNELKKEIQKIKDENLQVFEAEFSEIISLFEKEKMESKELSKLEGEDLLRFIDYYRDKEGYTEEIINEYLDDCDNDYHQTLAKLNEK